jgi:hypothetical protein
MKFEKLEKVLETMAQKRTKITVEALNDMVFKSFNEFRDRVMKMFDNAGFVEVHLFKKRKLHRGSDWFFERVILVKVFDDGRATNKDVDEVEEILTKKLKSERFDFRTGATWWEVYP